MKKACISVVWLSCSLRYIGHTQSHTNNGLLKLVEPLQWVQWCFLTHSIKLRAFPISAVTVSLHYLPRCLRSAVTSGKTPTTVTWGKPLKICCHVIVTQQRPTVEQSARKLRNLLHYYWERSGHKLSSLHYTERWTWLVCSVSVKPANKLSLQELNK